MIEKSLRRYEVLKLSSLDAFFLMKEAGFLLWEVRLYKHPLQRLLMELLKMASERATSLTTPPLEAFIITAEFFIDLNSSNEIRSSVALINGTCRETISEDLISLLKSTFWQSSIFPTKQKAQLCQSIELCIPLSEKKMSRFSSYTAETHNSNC